MKKIIQLITLAFVTTGLFVSDVQAIGDRVRNPRGRVSRVEKQPKHEQVRDIANKAAEGYNKRKQAFVDSFTNSTNGYFSVVSDVANGIWSEIKGFGSLLKDGANWALDNAFNAAIAVSAVGFSATSYQCYHSLDENNIIRKVVGTPVDWVKNKTINAGVLVGTGAAVLYGVNKWRVNSLNKRLQPALISYNRVTQAPTIDNQSISFATFATDFIKDLSSVTFDTIKGFFNGSNDQKDVAIFKENMFRMPKKDFLGNLESGTKYTLRANKSVVIVDIQDVLESTYKNLFEGKENKPKFAKNMNITVSQDFKDEETDKVVSTPVEISISIDKLFELRANSGVGSFSKAVVYVLQTSDKNVDNKTINTPSNIQRVFNALSQVFAGLLLDKLTEAQAIQFIAQQELATLNQTCVGFEQALNDTQIRNAFGGFVAEEYNGSIAKLVKALHSKTGDHPYDKFLDYCDRHGISLAMEKYIAPAAGQNESYFDMYLNTLVMKMTLENIVLPVIEAEINKPVTVEVTEEVK